MRQCGYITNRFLNHRRPQVIMKNLLVPMVISPWFGVPLICRTPVLDEVCPIQTSPNQGLWGKWPWGTGKSPWKMALGHWMHCDERQNGSSPTVPHSFEKNAKTKRETSQIPPKHWLIDEKTHRKTTQTNCFIWCGKCWHHHQSR